jgi:hypothetical protein
MIGKVIIVGYFIGIFFLSVFAHEGIHWLQYRDIKAKQICFFGKSFAYLDTPNTQIYALSGSDQKFKEEIVPTIATAVICFAGAGLFARNLDMFGGDSG